MLRELYHVFVIDRVVVVVVVVGVTDVDVVVVVGFNVGKRYN